MKPRFFRTPVELRAWFERNHATATELFIGYYKKESGRGGVVYKEALDEALCYGWIDGRVNRIDDRSYQQRWTPRKASSYWSQVNIGKAHALIAAGRMMPAGLAAFERRPSVAPTKYSSENATVSLAPAFVKQFKADKGAWAWYQACPPSYRRKVAFWVMSARQEETRGRRFRQLLECSREGVYIPPVRVSTSTDAEGRPLKRPAARTSVRSRAGSPKRR
ncbi:MAG: YdeI/OmpD-associated family protein [Gemmatimonadaceae bacterium]|nr:YdeI/OmpD-associated family protein [Gemmatimonadaceae bacterium]